MLDTERKVGALPKFSGRIDVENISFSYSPVTPPLITDLSVSIAPGARIGIVGGSGSGKSTLGRLMVALTFPQSGEIRLDGVSLKEIDNTALRTTVGYVDQTTTLISGSIRDNLTLWDSSVPDERIVAATKDAAVHDVIASRPSAYDTKLSENGGNFSGGERQRLAIARALVSDPSLIVLDEAMSALDAISEQAIIDNIRRRGCTCILIAHRISAVRDCDEILVLDHGQIVERGRHETLLAAGGPLQQTGQRPMSAIPQIKTDAIVVQVGAQIVLDRPDSGWTVKSGRVELFLVAVEDGRPVSRRQFLFEVKAGGNIMPLLETFDALQVVLIATEACTLEPLSFEVLNASAQHGGDKSKIPEQIDQWITGLSSAAAGAIGVPPDGTQALMPPTDSIVMRMPR